MSSALQESPRKMSVAEYLEFEERSDVRHEFYRGEIFAMAGGTSTHSRLQWRLPAILDSQLAASGCQGFNNDMRIKIEAVGLYTYPDASVACGQPQFEGQRQTTLLNPRAVFEVLSKSTQTYDRGEKFEHYCQLPSLHHYVLIFQSRRRVELLTRDNAGNWKFAYAEKPGDLLDLEFIGCRMSLDELYEGIELQPDEELRGRPAELEP